MTTDIRGEEYEVQRDENGLRRAFFPKTGWYSTMVATPDRPM